MIRLFLLRKIDIYLGGFCNLLFHPKRRKNKSFYKKILLIKLWGLGNLTIIWPLIYKIKERYPDSQIFFLTFDLNKNFLEKNEAITEVVYFRYSENIFKIITQFLFFLIKFRKEMIDIIVNFETFNNTSALFSYLIGAPLRIGLNNEYEKMFYTYRIDRNPSQHISQTFTSLLNPLGINSPYAYFHFKESKQDKLMVEDILKTARVDRFICIHPGTSGNFKGKRWSLERFSKLSNMLIEEYDPPLIFTGTEKERDLIEEIVDSALSAKGRIFNLAGKLKIWEFVELIRESLFFVSNDTGPVHIAASLGVNIAVLYGPTSPRIYMPLNKNSLCFYRGLKCSPCAGAARELRKCKNNFQCLDFSPREIFSEISGKFFNGKKNQSN